MSRKAKVIFFLEHKVRKVEEKKMKKILKILKKRRWQVHFGPCDETGKNAAAGVGVMWREAEVKIFPEKTKNEELAKAKEMGRAGKYIMDFGWEKSYMVYPMY